MEELLSKIMEQLKNIKFEDKHADANPTIIYANYVPVISAGEGIEITGTFPNIYISSLEYIADELIDAEDIGIMPADEFNEEYKYNKVTGKIIK